MKFCLLFFFFLFWLETSYALSLKEAERLALKNYPTLKALKLKAESLRKKAESVELSPLGELDIFTQAYRFNRSYLLTPMSSLPSPKNPPPFDRGRLEWGVRYTVPLYLGGNVYREVNVLRLKAEVLENLQRFSSYRLRFNVDSVFLSYLGLEKVEKALREYLRSLRSLERSVREGVEVGKYAEVDLLKVKAKLEEVKARLNEVISEKENLKATLEILIGRDVKTLEEVPIRLPEKERTLKELYPELLERNSLLKAKEGEVEVAKKEEEIQRGKYGLKVSLNFLYERKYGFDSSENEGYGFAGITVSYPIFDFGRKKLDVLSARLLRISKEKELEGERLRLKRELSESLSKLKAIRAKIEALKEKLNLAREVERIEELKYRSGKGDINHLLLAKSERFLTEAELKEAYYRWEIERRRIGTLLEER